MSGERFTIALAQVSASADRAANLAAAITAMERSAAAGARLIAFPELAIDRFFPQHRGTAEALAAARRIAEPVTGATVTAVREAARRLQLVTVFNFYEDALDGRFFDSSPVIDADGRLAGVTRMVHITDYSCFHEQDYYHPGDTGAPVYDTRLGRVGVAICYDRHYPEYMRALALAGAELVVIPQAGVVGEWPPGMFEAEVRGAAFQNGYWVALANRVGVEDRLTFAGGSFVSDPEGRVVARGAEEREALVSAEIDLGAATGSTARRLFLRHRRPELYGGWLAAGGESARPPGARQPESAVGGGSR